jgi:hypothetical protein
MATAETRVQYLSPNAYVRIASDCKEGKLAVLVKEVIHQETTTIVDSNNVNLGFGVHSLWVADEVGKHELNVL